MDPLQFKIQDVLLIGCVSPTEPLATFNAKLDFAPNCVGRLVDHNNDDILTAVFLCFKPRVDRKHAMATGMPHWH